MENNTFIGTDTPRAPAACGYTADPVTLEAFAQSPNADFRKDAAAVQTLGLLAVTGVRGLDAVVHVLADVSGESPGEVAEMARGLIESSGGSTRNIDTVIQELAGPAGDGDAAARAPEHPRDPGCARSTAAAGLSADPVHAQPTVAADTGAAENPADSSERDDVPLRDPEGQGIDPADIGALLEASMTPQERRDKKAKNDLTDTNVLPWYAYSEASDDEAFTCCAGYLDPRDAFRCGMLWILVVILAIGATGGAVYIYRSYDDSPRAIGVRAHCQTTYAMVEDALATVTDSEPDMLEFLGHLARFETYASLNTPELRAGDGVRDSDSPFGRYGDDIAVVMWGPVRLTVSEAEDDIRAAAARHGDDGYACILRRVGNDTIVVDDSGGVTWVVSTLGPALVPVAGVLWFAVLWISTCLFRTNLRWGW